MRGKITLAAKSITNVELPLTPSGTHIWRPFAPTADIDVDLEAKGWQWSGHGYFDANFGTRALEQISIIDMGPLSNIDRDAVFL